MVRVLECNRCGSVPGYDTVEEFATRVQEHHREAHRAFVTRKQVFVLARIQSWGTAAPLLRRGPERLLTRSRENSLFIARRRIYEAGLHLAIRRRYAGKISEPG